MLDKFDFQWETRQREQMESLIREVDRLRRLKTPDPKSDATNELDRLRFENPELRLLVAVIIRILEARHMTSPTEFIEMTEQVASELRSRTVAAPAGDRR
ncbi:MAG: hypothetical protein U0790_03140 [Isosphaeraceae bacterium]